MTLTRRKTWRLTMTQIHQFMLAIAVALIIPILLLLLTLLPGWLRRTLGSTYEPRIPEEMPPRKVPH